MSSTIEISLSKTKIFLLLLAGVGFVVLGVLFVLNPERFENNWVLGSPSQVWLAGLVSIIFFGLCVVFVGRKLFDERVGLIIDDSGITDNTSATSAGHVPWEDIVAIRPLQMASTKFLMVDTDKPEKYIERAKGGLAKRAMKANHRIYGSPICINSTSLKIKFSELEELVLSEFHQRTDP